MAQPDIQQDAPRHMSIAEYLAFEGQSDIKHEFVAGRVYAMSGGSIRHGVITVNISTDLNIQLEDTDCTVSSPDTRVKSEAMPSFRYPDVVVFCGEPVLVDERVDTLGNPIVLVEVLSPSTAVKDYNEKLEEYIKIDSLQAYVLVTQHTAKVQIFSRHESGKWWYDIVTGLDSTVRIGAIDCTLEMKRIYREVMLDEQQADDES
ncbi:MAG: Uma2 family endonuclease [Chloroflexota bacterium]